MRRVVPPQLALLLVLGLCVHGCSPPTRAESTEARPVELAIEFRALWWSEAQMEGLNPDSPPAKATPVVLKVWEYTDPVGVPHPDTVDVVVSVRNPSEVAVTRLEIRGNSAWKVGPQSSEAKSQWEASTPLPKIEPIDVAAHGSAEVRFPAIELKKLQDRLGATERWPWALKVDVSATSGSVSISTAEALLPIRPGD